MTTKISFTAGITSIDNFNFDADLSYSKELSKNLLKIQNQYHK